VRQVGATLGVAVLGTVLTSGYRSRLDVAGLPPAAANSARSGVTAGVAVAHAAHSASLLTDVQAAFVHGLGLMLWICGGIAVLSAILGLLFLPRRAMRAPPAAMSASATASTPAVPEPIAVASFGPLEGG
jgi:MFS transporter, DHA2 family, multidrug resistance protein